MYLDAVTDPSAHPPGQSGGQYRWRWKAGPMVLEFVFLHGTPWTRLSQKKQDLDYETQWKRFNAYGL